VAVVGELALQLVQRLARVWPGVDQGQRLVLDQVAVDATNGERRGNPQLMNSFLCDARQSFLGCQFCLGHLSSD